MKNCTDLDILDDFYFDYLINYAVGIRTLGEYNLAERTLNYFRKRVYKYSLENPEGCDLLFEQFINLLHIFAEKAGVSLEEQRTDTTLFMSNIKKSGRMSLAYDVLVQAVKAIPQEKRTDALRKVLEPNFKTDVLYRTRKQDGDSKLTQLLNLCNEALHILEAQPDMLDSEEVQITRRFLAEQSISDEQREKLIPKPNKEIYNPFFNPSPVKDNSTKGQKLSIRLNPPVLPVVPNIFNRSKYRNRIYKDTRMV
jgi:hypothetical protein